MGMPTIELKKAPPESISDSFQEFGWDIKGPEVGERLRHKGEEQIDGIEEEERTSVPFEGRPLLGLESPKKEMPTEDNLQQLEEPSFPFIPSMSSLAKTEGEKPTAKEITVFLGPKSSKSTLSTPSAVTNFDVSSHGGKLEALRCPCSKNFSEAEPWIARGSDEKSSNYMGALFSKWVGLLKGGRGLSFTRDCEKDSSPTSLTS